MKKNEKKHLAEIIARKEQHIANLHIMRETMLHQETWESLKPFIEAVTSGGMAIQLSLEEDREALKKMSGGDKESNSVLANAGSDELINELNRRGVAMEQKKVIYKMTLECFYKDFKKHPHPSVTEIRRPSLKEVWDAYQDLAMHHDMAVYTPYVITGIEEEPAA